MQDVERRRVTFNSEINRLWWNWLRNAPEDLKERVWDYADLRADWCGLKEWGGEWSDRVSVKRWFEVGPSHKDLYGESAHKFRSFCRHIGLDYETLMTEPCCDCREIFKMRLCSKLAQYKKSTGRSMKSLANHLGWSDSDYQWLCRVKARGADRVNAKGERFQELAEELGVTVDYLFGVAEAAEIPTWGGVIALGIEEFAKRQPTKSYFSDPQNVEGFLHSETREHIRNLEFHGVPTEEASQTLE